MGLRTTQMRKLFSKDFRKRNKLEGRLYGIIATIDFFYRENEAGALNPELYFKRIRALIGEALKIRIRLEKLGGFDFTTFVRQSDVEQEYRRGLQHLQRTEGEEKPGRPVPAGEESVGLDYSQLKQMPRTAVDFIVASIELTDLIRLELATVERVLPLLDEMKHALSSIPLFDGDYWVLAEINEWIRKFDTQRATKEIKGPELEKLGLQAERWFGDFRRQIRQLA